MSRPTHQTRTRPTNSATPMRTRSGNQCSLRAAIQEANARPGIDLITFDIPGVFWACRSSRLRVRFRRSPSRSRSMLRRNPAMPPPRRLNCVAIRSMRIRSDCGFRPVGRAWQRSPAHPEFRGADRDR